MKIVNDVIQYQYKQFMMSSKWIMPFIVMIAFVAAVYGMAPVGIVSSYSITGLFLFLIMVWVGVMSQELEPEVSEQIMILRLESDKKYYLCHVLFLVMLSGVVTIGMIVLPIVMNLLRMNKLFDRSLCWSDIIGGVLLMFSCSVLGTATGELFHIRIAKNYTVTVGLTFFVALLALVRSGVIAKYPVSKFLLWVIPPVSDVVGWFSNEMYFDLGKVVAACSLLMCYTVIFIIIKMELLCRKKF